MKELLKKWKSNKAFTMQDVIIAMIVIIVFVGSIGAMYVNVYKVQSDTMLEAMATLYAIQILENIDKISYDEVTNGMESQYRTAYEIPDKYDLIIEVSQYNTEENVKSIKLTISYQLSGSTETIVLDSIKVKEA